ncbi:MAG: M48 family metallopeptidase [Dehalococcoidia bacterium]|nr:M48 family metallopeptidase [Dehalococcoidia bacterium]
MWEQIKSNRLRSAVLVVFMGALLLAVGYFIGLYLIGSWQGGLAIAAVVWAVMGLVAFFQGDSILLGVSKARKIGKQDDPALYNVVEEMSLAAGLPKIPDVYIIDDPALNAFATGRDPKKSAVAITAGLRAKLTRDELQGVMAHEIGHIKNRDVMYMSIASVMLGAIVILSWYATRVMFLGGGNRNRNNSGGGGAGEMIIMVIGLLLLILAPLFAQLLYLATSRKREYLADASSALYTRYPEGLASALEKMATSSGTPVKAANKATAPMYIINPFGKKQAVNAWASTHPPITERVRILRSMGKNDSLAAYEQAYKQLHNGHGVVPKSALKTS